MLSEDLSRFQATAELAKQGRCPFCGTHPAGAAVLWIPDEELRKRLVTRPGFQHVFFVTICPRCVGNPANLAYIDSMICAHFTGLS